MPGPLTAKQARLVDGIRLSSRRLLGLVGQILDLGKLRTGRLELDRRPTDLRALLAACAEEIRPLADGGRLALEVAVPDGLPALSVDAERLHQVFLNLLSNAVRFTPSGGRITVSAAAGADGVTVAVLDTGVGVPPDLRERIFERYEQAPGVRGGTGLGLAVVKALVEAHGGRVRLHSEEGRGSRFEVVLPLAGAA